MPEDTTAGAGAPDRDDTECPHETLMPRWRGPEVMGDDSQAMGWVCHQCHREFPRYLVQDRKLRRIVI